MKEVIYYLILNGVEEPLGFKTEEEAKEYAEENNIEEYDVLPWTID